MLLDERLPVELDELLDPVLEEVLALRRASSSLASHRLESRLPPP